MKKQLALYLSLILCLAASGCEKTNTQIQTISKEANISEESYMKSNSVSLDIKNITNVKIPILDSVVQNAEVVLTGEAHNVGISTDLRMAFLKYFNINAGLKYYLIEAGYSNGVLLNQYLKNGDEQILHKLFSGLTGTYPTSKEEFEHYRELYLYNKSLPEDKKIMIFGIDIEHQIPTATWCLNTLIPDKEVPSAIRPVLEELKKNYSGEKYDREQIHRFSLKLKEDINSKRDVYKNFLGENLFDFEFVNENILNKLESSNQDGQLINRENSMYENFKKIYAHSPKGMYYGQFGYSHIAQRKTADAELDWLAAKLNYNDSLVKGKVISIAPLYDKSYQRLYDNSAVSVSNYMKNELIDSVVKSDLTLIRLDGEGSPFKNKLIFPLTRLQATVGVTTDYYQYFLFIRNSEATTVYEKPKE